MHAAAFAALPHAPLLMAIAIARVNASASPFAAMLKWCCNEQP